MAEITVYDNSTLDAAYNASGHLKTAEGLLEQASRMIAMADAECDVNVDCKDALEGVQASVVKAADSVNSAILKYNQGG